MKLGYFPLADSMAPSSDVLELFASESPIFGFCTFWGSNSRMDFGDGGTNLYQDPFICAVPVYVEISKKIAPFQNGHCPIASGVDKNGSQFCGF